MLGKTIVAVWEGTDGGGKTSLMNETAARLSQRGYLVRHHKTPSDSTTGKLAKTLGNSELISPMTRMLLFLANTVDDSLLMADQVRRESPDFYFIDRYYLCSLVYGLGVIERITGTGLEEELMAWVRLTEKTGRDTLLKPDVYIFVDVEEDVRRARAKSKPAQYDAKYEQDSALQHAVRRLYREFTRLSGEKFIWVENEENKLVESSFKLADKLVALRESILAEASS